jgi:ComF family protein
VCRRCLASPEPFLAEHFCVTCRTPFANSAPLDASGRCSLCRLGINGFDAAYSFGEYDGALRELIHLFKYGGVAPLANTLGALLSRALPRDAAVDVIVPMPLHWRRRWRRGFNQSELLARSVGQRTGVPVACAVRRRRATPPQAGLTRAERRDNVIGAFAVRDRGAVSGRRVLLIDDVLTTGATASACASVLKRCGARSVTVLTVARVDRRKGLFDF